VVIDSIQTLWSDMHEAGPGSVTQVRACAGELVRLAKRRGVAVIVLVGHVTKDGQIAGPRVVEHMVDAVLSFEGERGYPFRILRAAKNRFGATDEIGVFEMGDAGLRRGEEPLGPVPQRGRRAGGGRGGVRRHRGLAAGAGGIPGPGGAIRLRNAAAGGGRLGFRALAMVLAVLEARCGLGFGTRDVYLNVAGGLKISEPAADLAAAAALVSSASRRPCRRTAWCSARSASRETSGR
jgi:DNA repair protein RadA/Sms